MTNFQKAVEAINVLINATTDLSLEQSKIDKEINDIYHFIEFNNLSASNGYKVYKLLQSKLQSRRRVKNEHTIYNEFTKVKNQLDSINSIINTQLKAKYKPRELKELFTNGI